MHKNVYFVHSLFCSLWRKKYLKPSNHFLHGIKRYKSFTVNRCDIYVQIYRTVLNAQFTSIYELKVLSCSGFAHKKYQQDSVQKAKGKSVQKVRFLSNQAQLLIVDILSSLYVFLGWLTKVVWHCLLLECINEVEM